MPPPQLGIPEQLTLQAAPLQPTRILQELLPVQLTFVVFAAVLETVEAHALPPAQFTMHESPVHEIGFAHVSVSVHWMSHAGAVQMTAPVQLPAPTHLTLHASPAQRMVLVQEPAPTQLIAHELALWQSICPVHVPAPVQVTTQGMPSGQTMGFVHVPSTPQVTVQVPASLHVPTPASAQSAGHTAAASMRGAASASFVPASTGGGSPSLVTITSSPSRASVSLVLPSSAPNITSGKVHAAPASVPRLANARATMSLFFMGRVSRESRSLEDRPTHEDAQARPPPRGRHHGKIAAVRSRPPARRRSPRTIVDHRERCGFKLLTTMRVAIVGAGAVGGVIGARLHHAGHSVAFLTRGDSLEVLRADGLTLRTDDGTLATGPLAAFEDAAAIGPCELVIVTVKTWQVAALAPRLLPLVTQDTIVVPVQNGVEAADQLASALGDAAVVGGICHVIASREAPGRVTMKGPTLQLTLGERAGGASARLDRLAEILRGAAITTVVRSDIAVALWSKLLFVEPFGSVGAVTRASIDVVRALPETRALLVQAMKEVQAVAVGSGVPITDDGVTEALARIDAMPAGATTSMHRDLLEGRPSELEEQTGAVVRRGRSAGVACPVHEVLWASLLPQARLAR